MISPRHSDQSRHMASECLWLDRGDWRGVYFPIPQGKIRLIPIGGTTAQSGLLATCAVNLDMKVTVKKVTLSYAELRQLVQDRLFLDGVINASEKVTASEAGLWSIDFTIAILEEK